MYITVGGPMIRMEMGQSFQNANLMFANDGPMLSESKQL